MSKNQPDVTEFWFFFVILIYSWALLMTTSKNLMELFFCRLASILSTVMAHLWSLLVMLTISGPFVTTNFQSFGNNSQNNQDILLKFSAFVCHVPALIWPKNFGRYSFCLPATAHFSKTLDVSSDCICWDILKRKKLVRF